MPLRKGVFAIWYLYLCAKSLIVPEAYNWYCSYAQVSLSLFYNLVVRARSPKKNALF